MLNISANEVTHVVSVEPTGSLKESDFEQLDTMIAPIIAKRGSLPGLVIHTESFPGWASFAAFLANREFWKEHHKEISKVALVTDSPLGGTAETLTKALNLLNARHFRYADINEAREWAASPD